MDKDRIKYLYQRYIDDTCSAEELKELQSFLSDYLNEEQIRDLLDETWSDIEEDQLTDLDPERAGRLLHTITSSARITTKKQLFRPYIAAAALLLLTLAAGLFYYSDHSQSVRQLVHNDVAALPDIMPGGNKALLKLADGTTISLRSDKEGINAGSNELKYTDGSAVLTNNRPVKTDEILSLAPGYAMLSTPKGGQYHIVLADGTKVWLNSESSLKYPSQFAVNRREVELKGEGYFEVAKARYRPFIIKTAVQQVEVLGTHFNIAAYGDDETSKTSLIEGSIRISRPGAKNYERQNSSVMLSPGQQATVSAQGTRIGLSSFNVAEAIDWKEGLFIFNSEDIGSLMKRLSRWYNFEAVYQGDMEGIQLLGNYSRKKSLKNLLRSIELTGKVRFKIEKNDNGKERRVIIIAN